MKLAIHILEPEQDLNTKMKEQIRGTIEEHAQKAAELLGVDWAVNITVDFDKDSVIPEVGAGGFTPRKDWIQVSIDLSEEKHKIEDIIQTGLPATVYHEMNHIARWGGTGYGMTLPEAMISEGLATVFEKIYWPAGKPLWGEMSETEWNECLKIFNVREKSLDSNYSHPDWFFGSQEKPRWLGYKLGTYIVEEALHLNPESDILDLSKTSAAEIFKLVNIAI